MGRLDSEQLLDVCHLAGRYGTGEVHLTPGQSLIIPHVPDLKIGDLTAEPLLKILRYDPSEIMRGLVSYTGMGRQRLQGSKTRVDGRVVDAVTIFVAGKSGYGARLAEKIMEDVPCDRLSTIYDTAGEVGQALVGSLGIATISCIAWEVHHASPDADRTRPP
jgi:ferredoxin-nitrite reductase